MPELEYDTTLPEEVAPEAAAEAATPEGTPDIEAVPEAEAEVGAPTSPTFTVTVDGETFEVSAEEAIKGYQRQADYTRKTQEVAREREALAPAQQLWEAIENNPQQTVAALAAAYGFTLTPQQAAQAEAQRTTPQVDPFGDFLDPEETPASPPNDPRWEQVERFMQTQVQREQQAAVEAEVAAVQAKYGMQIDPQLLIGYALENDIGNLDAAFRAMSYEAAQQVAVRARKAGRKQTLPPVSGGHPITPGVVTPGAGSQFPSLDEAFAAAQAEANA